MSRLLVRPIPRLPMNSHLPGRLKSNIEFRSANAVEKAQNAKLEDTPIATLYEASELTAGRQKNK